MKATLTDFAVKNLKPAKAGKRYIIWDAAQPNFGVRITSSGARSFLVVRRRPGDAQPVYHVLGRYPAMKLGEAREAAGDALRLLVKGKHPGEVEAARRVEEARRRKDTFAVVAEDYLKHHVAKLRGARAVEGQLRRELIPRWKKRPITEITRTDVVQLVDEIAARAPYQARKVLALARKLFGWAVARSVYGLEHSPCDRIKPSDVFSAPAVSRDRVLADEELKRIWTAAGTLAYPFGTLVKVLLLSGQRLREIADAQWSEIDFGKAILTVPAARMKGKASHVVPLTSEVIKVLRTIPRFEGGAYLFTTTGGRRPISGFSKYKERLDAALGETAPWQVHDVRRTVRTRLSALPVPTLVAELVIGHRQQGIAKVYDLHRYDAEKRHALELWQAHLLAIVAPPAGDNVRAIRA